MNLLKTYFWTAFFAGISTTICFLRADAYDFWIKRDSGTARHLFASSADTNVIIAVGEQGTILASADGLAWRVQSLTSNTFYGVNLLVYGKTNFLAVGQHGYFASSDDGTHWQVGDFGVDHPFYGITSSGGLMAVGPTMVLHSANGLTWRPEWVNGLLFGVGTDPATRRTVVGARGLIWTKAGDQDWRDMLPPTAKTFTSIVGVDTFVVAVGDDGALLRGVYSSARGEIQWTSGPVFPEVHFKHVVFANGFYFAVGSDRSTADDYKFGRGVPSKGVLMTSPDGLRWTKRDVGNVPGLYSIQPFKGSLFAFGENGVILQNSTNNPRPAGSLDVWTPRLSNTTNALNSVASGNGTFVAVGGSGIVLTSPDGAAWERRAPITGSIRRVRFLDGSFVAVGDRILISPDGINWSQAVREGTSDPFGGNFSDVTHGPNGFLAVGVSYGSPSTAFSYVGTSTNGHTWRNVPGPSPQRADAWGGVAYGNGIYLAMGMYFFSTIPTVITSSDLTAWSGKALLEELSALPRFGPGYFLLLGTRGDRRVGFTTDGKNFELQQVPFSNSNDAIFAAGTWVAVGPGGFIFSSLNARDWEPRPSGTTRNLYDVTYGAETFVAVGENGTILQSGRVIQQRPLLSQARVNSQNQFVFVLGGESGREYVVQRSEDLVHWVDVMSSAIPGQSLAISSSNSVGFYRALPRSQ